MSGHPSEEYKLERSFPLGFNETSPIPVQSRSTSPADRDDEASRKAERKLMEQSPVPYAVLRHPLGWPIAS